MTIPSALLNALALGLYIPAAVCYAAMLFLRVPVGAAGIARPAPNSRMGRFGLSLLVMGMIAQFGAIGAWCLIVRRSPFASEYGTLTILAWIIAAAVAYCDIRFRLPAVGAAAVPVCCLVLFVGMLYLHSPVADTAMLKNRIVSMHVLAILASFALFALAFGCASLYLLQNRILKAHRSGGALRRLPPLATLDNLAYHAVAYALPLLTLGLTLGIAYIYSGAIKVPPAVWLTDPHNIVAFATWLLYVVYLAARLGLGWQGVRLQYILVAGLAVTLTLYIVPTSSHRFASSRLTYRTQGYR
jgi:ABC-type transport system involved in cytochrome c biogenesis permease subunit